MAECMVSTEDNPYNPFTHFDEWYAWDTSHGYHTCEYLARVCPMSSDLSRAQIDRSIEDAVDEIVDMNLTGNYIKVINKT